jgi:hypothetical protein
MARIENFVPKIFRVLIASGQYYRVGTYATTTGDARHQRPMQPSLGQLKARAKTTTFRVAWNITKGAFVSHTAASSPV